MKYLIALSVLAGAIALFTFFFRGGASLSKTRLAVGIASIAIAVGIWFSLPDESGSLADCLSVWRHVYAC